MDAVGAPVATRVDTKNVPRKKERTHQEGSFAKTNRSVFSPSLSPLPNHSPNRQPLRNTQAPHARGAVGAQGASCPPLCSGAAVEVVVRLRLNLLWGVFRVFRLKNLGARRVCLGCRVYQPPLPHMHTSIPHTSHTYIERAKVEHELWIRSRLWIWRWRGQPSRERRRQTLHVLRGNQHRWTATFFAKKAHREHPP